MKEVLKEKKNWLLLCWPIGLALYLLAKNNPAIAENIINPYIFRPYGFIVSIITGLLPFSLAELLIIICPIALIFFFIRHIVFIIRMDKRFSGMTANTEERLWAYKTIRKLRQQEVYKLFRNALIILGVVYLWFMVGCGTNYYRYEFSTHSGLEIKASTRDELVALCKNLVEKTNEARANLPENQQGKVFISNMTDSELAKEAKKAMNKLGQKYDCMKGYYPKPKRVMFSRVMSEFNITGVYFPFTVEANVNVDIPDYPVGMTMCHELSHLRGFMREDEANFIAYLACKESDNAEMQYSGYMMALSYAINRLAAEDIDTFISVYSMCSEDVRRDKKNSAEYWKQFEDTTLSEIGENVNNAYLVANNQSDGTKSYGRMVDLLLAEYAAETANSAR